MNIGLCIPTLQAAKEFEQLLPALESSRDFFHRRLVIDSSSTDNTVSMAQQAGFETEVIPRGDFDHGGTRQRGVEILSDCEIIVFLTQDAIPTGRESFESLTSAFNDPDIACAYGRQLPHIGATPMEAHARLFSYPAASRKKSKQTIPELGLRSAIVSNSFAAYRTKILLSLGGFPNGTLFGEDTLTGARAILAGYAIAYVGDATVRHSHHYTLAQEFRRYFDNGAFYAREHWILEAFGNAEGSGSAYAISEFKYLLRNSPVHIPLFFLSTLTKYAGYKAGALEKVIPANWKPHLSMNKTFWRNELEHASNS